MRVEEWREIEEVLAAALAIPDDQQEEFLARACRGRPQVYAEVRNFLAVRRKANSVFEMVPRPIDPAALPSAPNVCPGQKLGPYRVMHLLGEGGMGKVYLAERDDGQFQMEVAIKIADTSIAGSEALVRFRSERQILATLDHPNIARILDAGVSEDGRPFFVLEHVDGVPLLEYCRSREVTLRQRLELFRVVCSAVHFAHQNLIVHRDIKPGNILVTSAGVPKLLDFGIAKILDSARDSTQHLTLLNAAPMTPEYASPEQLSGGITTTASDIYSLGVVLYELLTGNRPFPIGGLTLPEAARLVTTAEPRKPSLGCSARRRELEGDLDSIALMALRSEPRQRYRSAEDLSTDIGQYLQGFPVLARHGTFQYVARKFISRHRVAMAVAVTAAVLIAAGGAATARSARIAQAERDIAQQRYDQIRQLANSLLFELHDSIAVLPGSTEVRRKLVARAMEYLSALERNSSGEVGLQVNLAQSYERLGSVQGHLSEMSLGDPQGALTSYARGIQILERLPAPASGRVDVRKELAHLHFLRGDVYRDIRDSPQRDREYEQGLAIAGPLAERFPHDEDINVLYSIALFGLGKAKSAENPEAARKLFLQSLAIDDSLLRLHPDDWKYQRNLALDHKYLSTVLPSHQEAIDHLRVAQELDERRTAAGPNNVQARLDLSYDLSEIGSHLEQSGDLAGALTRYRQMQSIRNLLLTADPQNVQVRLRVATASKMVAKVLAKMGRLDAALAEYRRAAVRAEAAIAAATSDPRNRAQLGEIEIGLAETEGQIARDRNAPNSHHHLVNSCNAYTKAAQILGRLVSDGRATGEERVLATHAVRHAASCGAQSQPDPQY